MQSRSRIRLLLLVFFEGTLCAQQTIPSTAPEYPGPVQLHNQAVNSQRLGRFADAESQFREALHAWEQITTPEPVETAVTLNDLGNLLRVQGRFLEAERLLRRAVALEERAEQPVQLDLAYTLNSLGALYCNRNQPTSAIPLLKRGLAIREQTLGSEHPLVASSLSNLADALLLLDKTVEAETLYRRALKILDATAEHPTLAALTNYKLAEMYSHKRRARAGNLLEAEAFYRQSLTAWDRAPERNHPQVGLSLCGLAEIYLTQQRYAEAEPLLKQALEIQEQALGSTHPQVARVLLDYASVLRKQHLRREAASMEERAKNIIKASDRSEQMSGAVDVGMLHRPH